MAPLLAEQTRTIRCAAAAVPTCHKTTDVAVADATGTLLRRHWRPRARAHVCPSCAAVVMCAPADGPIMAYAGQRAADRSGADGEKRHAITLFSLLSGALDAECGKLGVVEAGPWDPADPLNCRKCARFIAGHMPMPADPVPAPVEVPVQLDLFTIAA